MDDLYVKIKTLSCCNIPDYQVKYIQRLLRRRKLLPEHSEKVIFFEISLKFHSYVHKLLKNAFFYVKNIHILIFPMKHCYISKKKI